MKKSTQSMKRLDIALDALASLYDGGHLHAATQPDRFLMLVVDEIRLLRKKNELLQEARTLIQAHHDGPWGEWARKFDDLQRT